MQKNYKPHNKETPEKNKNPKTEEPPAKKEQKIKKSETSKDPSKSIHHLNYLKVLKPKRKMSKMRTT